MERSDTLLNTLIKGYFPELSDRSQHTLSEGSLIPEAADLTKLSDSDLELLEGILNKLENCKVESR